MKVRERECVCVRQIEREKERERYRETERQKGNEPILTLLLQNAIERLVEDLIVDAMAKGEFENLKGTGKPLPDRVSFTVVIYSCNSQL